MIEHRYDRPEPKTPFVSVVIPAYNASKFIRETLDSVLVQSYWNYEIIVVNDGSSDTEELEGVLVDYLEKIIYIKQENGGTASARNTGIYAARGHFLAFLDADDVWFPDYLELQMAAIKEKGCDLIYGDALLFGLVDGKYRTFMEKSPSRGSVTAESLIDCSCNIITSGTLVRRDIVLECGLFDTDLPRFGAEDFDLWFRLVKSGAAIDYQRRVLLKYRVSLNSLSGSGIARAERCVVGLDIIAGKYNLTATERLALAKQREYSVAELDLERGKTDLLNENFEDALAHFRRSNTYFQKLKLEILIILLKVNPKLVSKLYRKMRPTDFYYPSPTGSG